MRNSNPTPEQLDALAVEPVERAVAAIRAFRVDSWHRTRMALREQIVQASKTVPVDYRFLGLMLDLFCAVATRRDLDSCLDKALAEAKQEGVFVADLERRRRSEFACRMREAKVRKSEAAAGADP